MTKIKLREQFIEDLNNVAGSLPYNYNIMTQAGYVPLHHALNFINEWNDFINELNDNDDEYVQELEGILQVVLSMPYNIIKPVADILVSDERFEKYLLVESISDIEVDKKEENVKKGKTE